jgi:hypothetical protein
MSGRRRGGGAWSSARGRRREGVARSSAGGRRLAATAALLAVLALIALAASPSGHADPGDGAVVAQPQIGLPAADVVLAGAPANGAAGELWGYGRDGQDFALVRHTDADGWSLQPRNSPAGFRPLDGPTAARTTPDGGLVVAGLRDDAGGAKATLLVRGAGGDGVPPAAPLPDPDASVLLAGERLLRNNGAALAAVDEDGATGVYVPAYGGAVDAAILHWDGHAWSREPIDVPAASAGSFQVLALAASADGDAWLLAQEAPVLNRGVVLFQRTGAGPSAHWVERLLGGSPFADAAPAGTDAEAVTGGSWPGDPLSVTDDRVWVDGSAQADGERRDFALAYDKVSGQVTHSWCDIRTSGATPLCDFPLGAGLSGAGYRSFAFSGDGSDDGLRVLTNPLAAPGREGSSHGTWLQLDDSGAARRPGIGGNGTTAGARGGAFAAPGDGWLGGTHAIGRIAPASTPSRLVAWPLNVRHPLTAAATAPGATAGDPNAAVVAVGEAGTIVRYTPGAGWAPEFLLNAVGQRLTPNLRAVAWPVPNRANAVGDDGEMWLWRAETGLWERDEAAPNDLVAQLMGVAFAPGSDNRGFAVGKAGTLLRYGKSWTQDPLPPEAAGADLTSIAFAGNEALVAAGRHLLVEDGSGWRVDPGVEALMAARPNATLFTVAGLPDGGAVAAGQGVVLERDGAAAPWHPADRPLAGVSAVAAAAVRDGASGGGGAGQVAGGGGPPGRLRAVLAVTTDPAYPAPDVLPPADPGQPPPLVPADPLPQDGFVLRETAAGWRDEQHAAWEPATRDLPAKPDAVLALVLSPAGDGWAFGGITGEELTAAAPDAKRRAQTAAAYRYGGTDDTAPLAPPGVGRAPIPEPTAVVRFVVGGHSACMDPCADLSNQAIAPDRMLTAGLGVAAQLAAQPHGPRAFLSTGTRIEPGGGGLTGAEGVRLASLDASVPGAPPVFPAIGGGDAPGGDTSGFRAAFADALAPLGSADPPGSIDTASIPGAPANPLRGARTHYAFDSYGPEGIVRVIVIDNSAGSLAASDADQNPHEPQQPWLSAVLDDARANGIPAIVVGSRSLDSSDTANAASDADEVAHVLLDGGASAYFYDSPGENRARRIPAGAPTTIPAFGSGTLGYPRPQVNTAAWFGESGVLLTEVDTARRDPQTNRAPVSVRLIPVLEDLSIDPTDGVLIRRSRVALFQGLGRLPRAGRVSVATEAAPPYVALPPTPCVGAASCATKIAPEFTFSSADPDLGDFVAHDPSSSNPRAVLLDSTGHPIADPGSGLFCAFNAGSTSVTIAAGGFSYSQQLTIQPGAVQRPCGTRPLNPSRFHSPAVTPAAPEAQQPASPETPAVVPPPPPAPLPAPPSAQSPPPPAPAPPVYAALPVQASSAPPPLAVPPPPVSSFARPIPPGGAVVRVYEEKREEEVAPEQQSAFAAYSSDDRWLLPAPLLLLLVALVGAGAGTAVGRARQGRAPRRRRDPALQLAAPRRRRR